MNLPRFLKDRFRIPITKCDPAIPLHVVSCGAEEKRKSGMREREEKTREAERGRSKDERSDDRVLSLQGCNAAVYVRTRGSTSKRRFVKCRGRFRLWPIEPRSGMKTTVIPRVLTIVPRIYWERFALDPFAGGRRHRYRGAAKAALSVLMPDSSSLSPAQWVLF